MTKQPTSMIKKPKWWKRRTNVERNMIIVAGLMLSVFSFMTPTSAIESLPPLSAENSEMISKQRGRNRSLFQNKEYKKDVCNTPGCAKAAAYIINNMDPSVNPCDDFYQFACGKYLKDTILKDNEFMKSYFNYVDGKVQDDLRMIITEPILPCEGKPTVIMKLLYKSCMDDEKIEKQGLGSFKEMLKSLGGWPVLEAEKWNEDEFTWTDSVFKFRETGHSIEYLINVEVINDYKNNSRRAILLDAPKLGIKLSTRTNDINNETEAEYYKYMVDIAVLLGADRQRAIKELRDSLDFEKGLAKIHHQGGVLDLKKSYNFMKIDDLQKNFTSIPWQEYLNKLLNPLTIQQDDIFIVTLPKYYSNLEILLTNTPKRTQANYMIWRAVMDSIPYLTEELTKRQFEYTSTQYYQSSQQTPRLKKCLEIVKNQFKLGIQSLYVQRNFDKSTKNDILEMTMGIREEMYKLLSLNDWMDDKTRKFALAKEKSIINNIAYPDELLDESKLNGFYKNLDFNDKDFNTLILSLNKLYKDYDFSKLRQPAVNRSDWIEQSSQTTLVNAFYQPTENSINIPAAVLQDVFYSTDRPMYMNYGSVGSSVGHEIVHGFDIDGKDYDKDGNMVEWWSEEANKSFMEKSECLVRQYENYTEPNVGLKLNGSRTLGDNTADNGGVKLAYYAYNTWTKQHGVEPNLPGLEDYTPQQMFWISNANLWCSKESPLYIEKQISIDVHSPPRFRIIGSFSNQDEFSNDFQCPLGSNMNPVKKCQLW